MPTEENLIKQTSWEDEDKSWQLEGMAQATFDWLSDLVAGSEQHQGWELVGTLDPENPSPTSIPEPPRWRTPQMMMQAMCAWFSSSAQDFLFRSGTVPLVRAEFDKEGDLVAQAGADVGVATWRYIEGQQILYFIVVDQQESAFPLSSTASISVTVTDEYLPIGHGTVTVSKVSSDGSFGGTINSDYLPPDPEFSEFAGFIIQFNAVPATIGSAFVHIYA